MYADLNEAELDVIANGRRAHELSRGVAYMLDHRDAPEEFLRSIVNLPKEFEMETVDGSQHTHTITSAIPSAPGVEHTHSPLPDAFALARVLVDASPVGDPSSISVTWSGCNGETSERRYTASDSGGSKDAQRLDLGAPFRTVGQAIATRDALEAMEHAAPAPDLDAELRDCGVAEIDLPKFRALVIRVGKKMASKRLTKLKGCRSGLDEVISECEQEENCPEEMPGDMEAAATPEVAHEAAPEVPAIDPNEALRDLGEKLVRTVEREKQRRYVSEVLGDLTSKLEALVS